MSRTDADAAAQAAAIAQAPPMLRVSHIWRDEVMADRVIDEPRDVTLGNAATSCFTIPPLGLPEDFAILRPGARGYVLTMGTGMAGRIKVGGRELDVEDFLSGDGTAEGSAGKFRATPVGPGDWGVIDLDASGQHQIFFHFVKPTPPLPRSRFRDSELLLPAFAFAIVLHAIFVAMSYQLKDDRVGLLFPGGKGLMHEYLKDRPVARTPEPESDSGEGEESASEDGDKENVNSATKGASGKAGGEGEQPRAKAPDPAKGEPDQAVPERVETGLLTKENRTALTKVAQRGGFDKDLGRAMARLHASAPVRGGSGSGRGTGIGFGPGADGTGTTRGGTGRGPGGGGSAEGDFQSQGKIDTGETRSPKGTGGQGRAPKEVAVVGTGTASGSFNGLTKAEIDRVVKSRRGLIRACYQRELNRSRGLGGKLVVNFKIDGRGKVKSTRVVSGKSSLRHPGVESCVKRQISKLQFPAKGGTSIVNYPFIFSQG